jgi:hypothetical protein
MIQLVLPTYGLVWLVASQRVGFPRWLASAKDCRSGTRDPHRP